MGISEKSRIINSYEFMERPHDTEQGFGAGRGGVSCRSGQFLLGLSGEEFHGLAAGKWNELRLCGLLRDTQREAEHEFFGKVIYDT